MVYFPSFFSKGHFIWSFDKFSTDCHAISGTAPLTAVQLLWVNMIMDTLGALALATEPPNDELMKRKPVGRGVSFITRTMWRNIIGQSIYQLLVLGLLMFDGKRLLKLNGSDATAVLNTFIFNSFVFCQVNFNLVSPGYIIWTVYSVENSL